MFSRYKRNQFIALFIILLFGAGVLLMWSCIIPGFLRCKDVEIPPLQEITLEFWNVFEDSDIYLPFIDAFEQEHPNVTIEYRKKLYSSYERDLDNAFSSSTGPDIFSINNTWLPKQKNRITPVPQSSFTLQELKTEFPDVVQFDFADEDPNFPETEARIYALPLFIDTLALFYNSAYFENVNLIGPPETWDEFVEYVKALRTTNDIGRIDLAGAALGTSQNINRSTDILGLLMLQTGARMTDATRTSATFAEPVFQDSVRFDPGAQALEFYTSFADPVSEFYTWNEKMPGSTDAFIRGDTAMILNYSYAIPTLEKENRYLEFEVAPVPQPRNQTNEITYANYWGLTVSRDSLNADLAWEFILSLLEEDNIKSYLQTVQRPTSLKKLIFWQESILENEGNTKLKPFVGQILNARSWYQGDNTKTERAIMDMIDSVVAGEQDISQALTEAAEKVTLYINEVHS